jgi:hypothetical protein
VKVFCTCKAHKAVSQIVLLKQNEDHKNDDDARGRKRMDKRLDESREHLEGPRIRLPDLDGYRPTDAPAAWRGPAASGYRQP